jgi:NDP-sugar pyrophosphorylase family protein
MSVKHCVVLAGGLGTRISEITGGLTPKALVDVCGKPFLYYKISSLIEMGFDSIDVLIGQHGNQISKYLDTQQFDKAMIRCFNDGPELLGTAGSIAAVVNHLPDSFWVTYADSYVMADIKKIDSEIYDTSKNVMVVLKNSNSVEPSNVKIDVATGEIVSYQKGSVDSDHEWIDYGLLRFNRRTFEKLDSYPIDLNRVISDEIALKNLYSYEVVEKFWDVGTPERLDATRAEFAKRGFGE